MVIAFSSLAKEFEDACKSNHLFNIERALMIGNILRELAAFIKETPLVLKQVHRLGSI